jgi:uncharacterized membrane protein (UPF0127 family)
MKSKNNSIFLVVSIICFIGAAIFVSLFIFSKKGQTGTNEEIPQDNGSLISIVTKEGNEIKIDVEYARTPDEWSYGLMSRTSMNENHGMLFVFPVEENRTFWMKNTLISLDILYIDSNKKIVSIARNTKTNQTNEVYPSLFPSQYVLEVNGGFSEKNGINEGDEVQW